MREKVTRQDALFFFNLIWETAETQKGRERKSSAMLGKMIRSESVAKRPKKCYKLC